MCVVGTRANRLSHRQRLAPEPLEYLTSLFSPSLLPQLRLDSFASFLVAVVDSLCVLCWSLVCPLVCPCVQLSLPLGVYIALRHYFVWLSPPLFCRLLIYAERTQWVSHQPSPVMPIAVPPLPRVAVGWFAFACSFCDADAVVRSFAWFLRSLFPIVSGRHTYATAGYRACGHRGIEDALLSLSHV